MEETATVIAVLFDNGKRRGYLTYNYAGMPYITQDRTIAAWIINEYADSEAQAAGLTDNYVKLRLTLAQYRSAN